MIGLFDDELTRLAAAGCGELPVAGGQRRRRTRNQRALAVLGAVARVDGLSTQLGAGQLITQGDDDVARALEAERRGAAEARGR
ncbi:MAG: hypothetical protein IPI67_41660 [Myxococcales bacterium]|nr:hypothetical protein [Myxococcales bacterium]